MVPSISAARESWRGTPKCEKDVCSHRDNVASRHVYEDGSPLGTDPENGSVLVCWGAEFYSSGSLTLPELREASPCTLHIYLLTLATEKHKTGGIKTRTRLLPGSYLNLKQLSGDVSAAEKSRLCCKGLDCLTSAVSCRWASFAAPKCWVSSSFSKACWEHSRKWDISLLPYCISL